MCGGDCKTGNARDETDCLAGFLFSSAGLQIIFLAETSTKKKKKARKLSFSEVLCAVFICAIFRGPFYFPQSFDKDQGLLLCNASTVLYPFLL